MLKVNSYEQQTYFAIWISANIYSLYQLYVAEKEILSKNDVIYEIRDLVPGWNFLARYQDVSDFEWNTWKHQVKQSWLYLLLQFLGSEVIRKTNNIYLLHYWYIIISVIFIFVNISVHHLLILGSEPLIYGFLLCFGFKRKVVWCTSISILLLCDGSYYNNYIWTVFYNGNCVEEDFYLLQYATFWTALRCMSFCFDYIENVKQKNVTDTTFTTFLKLFSYTFYLPVFYSGPFIMYSDFEKSFVTKSSLANRLKCFVNNLFIFLFYIFLLELALHYFYFMAMQEYTELIRQLPTMALCGGGLWMGLEFHIKYVISYGMGGALAFLDNIEAPPTPRCISRVHIYSQMWRYFDVGLYKFLIKYIYVPLLDLVTEITSLPRALQKLIASFIVFLFILLWHGVNWAIFIWTVLNFIGISCESFGKIISETSMYKLFKETILKSDAMEQRFIALLCTPLLALSAVSNFYLFADYKVGNLFFECMANPSLWNTLIVFISLYSCCHVSMVLKDVPSRTTKQKLKEL